MAYIFAFRELNDERDAVSYMDTSNGRICGCAYYGKRCLPYNKVETILTNEQYNDLISENFDNYSIEDFIELLSTDEAKEFKNKIEEDEINIMCNEWNIDRDDCIDLIEEYQINIDTKDYFDRGMIATVYDNVEEVASEVLSGCGYFVNLPDWLESYIDLKGIGDMLVSDDESYYELADGRVVSFNF